MVSDSKQDIQSRLENVAAGSGRLYAQSFLGRAWLADYVADVDSVCDELRAENERLKTVEIVSLEAEVIAHVDEIERLRAEITTWGQIWNDEPLLTARVEALRDGTAQT